jgi:hypothetical protein
MRNSGKKFSTFNPEREGYIFNENLKCHLHSVYVTIHKMSGVRHYRFIEHFASKLTSIKTTITKNVESEGDVT